MTLNGAFRRADARTVALMPAITRAWPEGKFFGYDKVYDNRNLGYRGPRFSFATMPDQYTLSTLQRTELAKKDRAPVMAETALVSSHAPWASIPRLIPWDQVGDGSVFNGMGKGYDAPWPAGGQIRTEYRKSIEYTLNTLVSYVETYGDDDTVLVFLGDHQPAPLITGPGASRDVPITIVAKDEAVLDRTSGWGWQDGLRPAKNSPVWPMSDFRDRFLTAFGADVPVRRNRTAGGASREAPPGPSRAPRRRWLLAVVAAALLAQMAVAMVSTAVRQTPTIDEPVYVATGVVYLREHDLRYNPEHPPLGKLIIGAGAVAAGPRLDTAFTGDQFQIGPHLLYRSGNDAQRVLLAARLPVIALTLLFGLVVFAFARDLTGPAGGWWRSRSTASPRPDRPRLAGHAGRADGRFPADVGVAAVAGEAQTAAVPATGGSRAGRRRRHQDERAARRACSPRAGLRVRLDVPPRPPSRPDRRPGGGRNGSPRHRGGVGGLPRRRPAPPLDDPG